VNAAQWFEARADVNAATTGHPRFGTHNGRPVFLQEDGRPVMYADGPMIRRRPLPALPPEEEPHA
jgi:hypothetical protein